MNDVHRLGRQRLNLTAIQFNTLVEWGPSPEDAIRLENEKFDSEAMECERAFEVVVVRLLCFVDLFENQSHSKPTNNKIRSHI